jgi:2-keto-4-pentenoate hydratase
VIVVKWWRTLDAPGGDPRMTLEHAYAVQAELTALHVAAGRRVAGYKLGYTSLVMRRQMGIDAPNYGPLYEDMIVGSCATVDGYMQPRLEPEVAVVLGRDLGGPGLLLHEVAAAIAEVRSSLEIVDSVWRDYRFTVEQNTADGSSAAGVVPGPELGVDPVDCHRVSVCLDVDGDLVGTATAAAAGGHPLNGVAWLCEQLAQRGEALRKGQVVITGGLTAAVPLNHGSRVEAVYDRGVAVDVR